MISHTYKFTLSHSLSLTHTHTSILKISCCQGYFLNIYVKIIYLSSNHSLQLLDVSQNFQELDGVPLNILELDKVPPDFQALKKVPQDFQELNKVPQDFQELKKITVLHSLYFSLALHICASIKDRMQFCTIFTGDRRYGCVVTTVYSHIQCYSGKKSLSHRFCSKNN